MVNMTHQEPGTCSEARRRQHVNFPRAKRKSGRSQIPQRPLQASLRPPPPPNLLQLASGSCDPEIKVPFLFR